ncbi:MAG: TusE/DsrC/DsvC family sulfur relay protein [Caldilineae bacterium]|nr:MAG: TusE/DsrC/DsvC family sulfur relay protein [Caldilineae bacterium]
MPTIEYKGQMLELDEDGFLQDPSLWNDELALFFAPMESVPEMTEDHWKIVRYIRNYYEKYGIAPMIRKIAKDTGIPVKRMYQLFPTGLDKGACRIAGLPKPTGCV